VRHDIAHLKKPWRRSVSVAGVEKRSLYQKSTNKKKILPLCFFFLLSFLLQYWFSCLWSSGLFL
jgi:hypothetical protein